MLQNVRLYIGAHDIYGGKDYEVRKVKKLAFHKGFNGQQFRDDIALMVLDSPVMFSESIKPVCLYSGSPPVDGGETNADSKQKMLIIKSALIFGNNLQWRHSFIKFAKLEKFM